MHSNRITFLAALLVLGSSAFAQNGRPYYYGVASGNPANGMTFSSPVVNNNGSIAFDASKYLTGTAILTGADFFKDAFVSTADPSGPFSSGSFPHLNNAGSIAFRGTVRATGEVGVFVGLDPEHNLAAGIGAISHSPTGINNNGQVAISADFGLYTYNPRRNHDAIYVGQAGVTGATFVAENTRLSAPGQFRRIDSEPAINDAGTIAFVAQTWDDTATGRITGIYTGNTTASKLIDSTGSFLTFGGGWVDINNSGTLLFAAIEDGSLTTGLYRGTAVGTELVASENADFIDINGRDINNNGDVVFNAQTGGSGFNGIFNGPTLDDRVIGPGDEIFGSTVRDAFFRRGGFNDNGDVGFYYITTDGLSGIAVATPATFGDADLNHIVDFDDYSRIDNGFNNN
ncbi:MAG: hypothetical protein H7Z14_04850, partial [Anaerolineae bacterium]|nr:hypothetical protein [Phycisphaerae bacterium]